MDWRDDEDEDQQYEDVAADAEYGAPEPRAPKPELSDLERAEKQYKRTDMISGILEGLSTAVGGSKADGGFYENMRKQAQADLHLAKKQAAAREKAVGDANSPQAEVTRRILTKKFDLEPGALDGMSTKQQLEFIRQLPRAQQAALDTGTEINAGIFNPGTGTYETSSFKKGLKPEFDSTTGTVKSASDMTAPAKDVLTPSGQTLRDLRTETDATRVGARTTATIGAKKDQEIRDAEAAGLGRKLLANKWLKLYEDANKEGGVGPGAGQFSQLKNKMGFSAGKATDALINSLQSDTNRYIKESSGATVTPQEQERLMRARPQVGQDRALFNNSLKEYLAEVDKMVAEKRAARAGGQTAPAAGSRKIIKKEVSPSTGKTRITYDDGTTEIK